MSGHNKWSQIKHKKAKEDSKRGYAFTKLVKEITVSARRGGGDPAGNAHLRGLLEKAKEINMPIENSTRAIKRGIGELPGVTYDEFMYEGYGPNHIAVIVETLSDNKNRTVAELRRLFNENGGTLGDAGSVSWMFEKMGVISINGEFKRATEDELLELLFDYDIKDLNVGDGIAVYCDPKAIDAVRQTLESAGFKIESAGFEWIAKDNVELAEKSSDKAVDFLSSLQDHDDVQNVYTNLG
jgi:YebC/PmpR family DNA-binding regulatory protein